MTGRNWIEAHFLTHNEQKSTILTKKFPEVLPMDPSTGENIPSRTLFPRPSPCFLSIFSTLRRHCTTHCRRQVSSGVAFYPVQESHGRPQGTTKVNTARLVLHFPCRCRGPFGGRSPASLNRLNPLVATSLEVWLLDVTSYW